jgi:hypothetical protein
MEKTKKRRRKMKKKLIIMLLMAICIGMLLAQTAVAPATGDGTSGNPYQIATWQNIYWISQNSAEWSKHYTQIANIDFADAIPAINTWDGGAGFLPIGNGTTYFIGSYDGQGHTISNLYINRPYTLHIALFGYTWGSVILDLGMVNVDITGRVRVGGLVGLNSNNSSISNSYSTGNITGIDNVGGLVGYNFVDSIVSNCFSTGNVIGSNCVGGLVGYNYDDSSVSNSYSTGNVSGSTYVGGLTGCSYLSSITNSYSSGSVSGSSSFGGLVGYNNMTVSNCFWDAETDGIAGTNSGDNNFGATGKTTLEMKTQSTFTDAGWDFTSIWNINETNNNGYPFLQWQTFPLPGIQPVGSGTGQDPYQITVLENLLWLAHFQTATGMIFTQMNDIDASVTNTWENGDGFIPIGNIHQFRGYYDGQGYTISNLYINRSEVIEQGLFGNTRSCIIRNLGVINAEVVGFSDVGILIGNADEETRVWNCFTSGDITANRMAGGMIGTAYDIYLENSYNTVNILSPGGNTYIGGLIGYDKYSSITNCYNIGSLMNPGVTSAGGLVGYGEETEISSSFWDNQITGFTVGVGVNINSDPGEGKTSSEMKSLDTYISGGWDFLNETQNGSDDDWGLKAYANDGYPYLSWQSFPADFPSGDNTDVGGSTTINPSVDLNYAADQTIPPIPNPSFIADYEVVLSGTGIVDITISTSYMFGSIYQNGSWDTVGNSGGIIFFENVDFDARGDVPLVLGDEDAALPVTLSSFTATFTGNSSILQWTTQSESNNAGWNIYRAESEEFSFASRINPELIHGAGTTNELTEYSYADESGFEYAATYYYWLESVDYANITNLHGPINVEIPEQDNPDAPEIVKIEGIQSIYPNPFNPSTTVSYYLSKPSEVNLEIFNVKGQKIYSQILNQDSEGMHYFKWNGVDSQNKAVTSGIYFIKLKTAFSEDIEKAILMK